MGTRKRTAIPYQVRQIARKHSVSIQQALIVYNDIQRARAVSSDNAIQAFASNLSQSIQSFKLSKS